MATPKAAVDRCLVEDQGVLDIVPRERHDGHSCVLPSRQLVVPDQLDRLGLDHGLLGVCHEVEQGVDSVELIVGDGTDGLLARLTGENVRPESGPSLKRG